MFRSQEAKKKKEGREQKGHWLFKTPGSHLGVGDLQQPHHSLLVWYLYKSTDCCYLEDRALSAALAPRAEC
jgi:hypothetical protein